MPVIDETEQTLEFKRLKKEVLAAIEDLRKKVSALEEKKGK